jgi:hypothetical protein
VSRAGTFIEWFFTVVILTALAYAIWFTMEYGQVPAPFFYEPSDTFMDWFNTAYYANNTGAYDDWKTLYPPISFLFVRIFSISSCYQSAEGINARDDCDWLGLVALAVIFFLNFALIALTMYRLDRVTAIQRTISLGMGLPMLHGFERGNLVVVTFTLVLLAFGPLIRSARLRWLFIGLAINFKIYLIASIFPQLLRRRWRWFEGAAIATILVYIISAALLGAGSLTELFQNISAIVDGDDVDTFLVGWLAATYVPFISILNSNIIPISSLIGSLNVEALSVILPLLQRAGQVLIAAAAIAAWLRPEAAPMHRLTHLGILMALITSEAGAYTLTLIGLFVFMEKWQGWLKPISIICFYILCIPGDIIIDYLFQTVRESYIGGRPVVVNFALTIGPFVRPLFVLIIAYCCSLMILADVRRDFAANPGGWRRRFSREFLAAR